MSWQPKSIDEQIECLARLTGAPGTFVQQVRSLFTSKGISLDTDAEPFVEALEEAFRREENIRFGTRRAKENLDRMQHDFERVGRAYISQLGSRKERQSPRARAPRSERHDGDVRHVTIRGDHRTFVMRPVREELPLVPGPRELQ
jgi:hypothetical protein